LSLALSSARAFEAPADCAFQLISDEDRLRHFRAWTAPRLEKARRPRSLGNQSRGNGDSQEWKLVLRGI